MRTERRKREASAIIKLRRDYAYSKSIIAAACNRSTSFIQRILETAERMSILPHRDFRKMPNQTRRLSRSLQWIRLMKWMPRWEAWILGSEERPP